MSDPIGWITLEEAEDYFLNERLETDAWDDLVEDSAIHQKSKALQMAYNRLYYDPRWTLPTHAEATATDLIVLQKAQTEETYYLAQHLTAEDHRKAIQAQGVIEAGVVKEKYSEKMLNDLPVPPFVIALLEPWFDGGACIGAANLARDEDESVRTKVHEF